MANEEQVAILKQGVKEWNAWRHKNPVVRPNLTEARLEQANLIRMNLTEASLTRAHLRLAILFDADLTGARLEQADMTEVRLEQANLTNADLTGADLTEANLYDTNLSKANVIWANLTGANLQGANLTGANLKGANLTRATIGGTVFTDTDLSGVKGLETIRYNGPSSIGVDTLVNSGGKIPQVFLRGCGVLDSLIEYLPSLIGAMEPIQFYSCFISYSTKDEEFAKRLHGRMQQEHLRVWFAPEELKGGEKLRDQIDQAIRVYDKLLLVLSDASMTSDWVAHEVRRAYQKERAQGKRVLFPVRLCDFETLKEWELPEDDTGRDLAIEVRRYFIPDLSNWKDYDTFETAFARLLKDLRATATL